MQKYMQVVMYFHIRNLEQKIVLDISLTKSFEIHTISVNVVEIFIPWVWQSSAAERLLIRFFLQMT